MTARRATQPPRRPPIRNVPAIAWALPQSRCLRGDPVRVRYVRFWPRTCRLV